MLLYPRDAEVQLQTENWWKKQRITCNVGEEGTGGRLYTKHENTAPVVFKFR